jgi:prevent-host-death family protein
MTTITWRELRENLADMINRVRYQNERIAITRHGKVVAELVPSAPSAVVAVAGQQHHAHHQAHSHPEVG